MMIYLDNAATSRKKPYSVYSAMLRYSLFHGGNAGRGANALSQKGVNAIISAQEAASKLFDVENESNIIFTQNATYALNMAILGTLTESDHIVVTAMDHNSVLRPAALHGNYSVADADKYGTVSPISVRRRIKNNTKLVVCTHVSNVCGAIEPVTDIARVAHDNGALFLLDASQSAGTLDVSMKKINADMIACPGHKGLMGPMGTGILCIKDPDKVRAVIVGGTGSESEQLTQPQSMPDKFHSGTLNTPAIAGLQKGIEFVLKEGAENIGKHEHYLNSVFRNELKNMDNIIIYGRGETGITAFNIQGMASADAAAALGSNIIVRAGYHCAPLAHKALGTDNGGAVRVSFGYFNTINDVHRLIDAIHKNTRL
ncbi:MAG: aminotransferase class V-fold PLP-dependent enzyme [Clostridia bacterium]|nr:aminotransferase class V-fold PLP-dependent enzyme [Clostridia bacterium]